MAKLRVALVHDYIKEYGGAERVLEKLHELYPDATVFTSVYIPRFLGPHRKRFKDWKITTSWFQYVPFKHKLISPLRLLAPIIFKQFNLSEFDVVIVSATGAYTPNMVRTKNKKSPQPSLQKGEDLRGAVQICYCHTPPRYLYGYATARDWKKYKLVAFMAHIANHFLRITDFTASKNVDYYIANSQEIAGRIKKFYRRDATVIYPPVEIRNSKFEIRNKSKHTTYNIQHTTYYLTGGRLARAKHIDLIVRACNELGVPLKVFGRGFAGYEEEVKAQSSKFKKPHPNPLLKGEGKEVGTIEFLGEVSDEEKFELMKNARAFLFASEDEDFGIVPVESMAVGTPVIAHKSGGVQETVIDGKTGVFFNQLTVSSLKEAIKRFETLHIDPAACYKQAEKFSKERFKKEIKQFVDSVIKK